MMTWQAGTFAPTGVRFSTRERVVYSARYRVIFPSVQRSELGGFSPGLVPMEKATWKERSHAIFTGSGKPFLDVIATSVLLTTGIFR